MNKRIRGDFRLAGFDSPTAWTIMTPLAIKMQSVNFGQGFPSQHPAELYGKILNYALTNSNHQYVRAYGSLTYTKAIADTHKKDYGNLDHQNTFVQSKGMFRDLTVR